VRAGNFLVGSSLFHLGQLEESLRHINEAIRIRTGPESILALFAGPHVSVFGLAYQAHLTWHCGEEEQAIARAAEAVSTAKYMQHPFSQAIALDYATLLDVFRSDSRRALEHGMETVELCRRYGFTYYLAMADILTGWARAAEGDTPGGLAQLREGLGQMRRLEAEIRMPFYLKLLAATLGRDGLVSEALANLSTGFALARKNNENWTLAELHRTQGELLAGQGKIQPACDCFLQGLAAARRSGSVALQKILSDLAAGTPTTIPTERS
jgi:predicted ATPase